MKTINVSFGFSKVNRVGERKQIATGSDGKVTGNVRGLNGKKIDQLLGSMNITMTVANEGHLVAPFDLINLPLTGEIEVIKAGDKFSYTEEQLKSIGEITARRTPESEPEVVKAGVEYVAMHDGFRITDFESLQLHPSDAQKAIFRAAKYNVPKATAAIVPASAEEMD